MTTSAGFDIGNRTSCVSLSHDGAVRVSMNAEGCYETLSTVQYGKKRVIPSKERPIPYRAAAPVVSGVKHLLGKFYGPCVEKEVRQLSRQCSRSVRVCENPRDNGKCSLRIPSQQHPLAPEQVLTTLVKDLKRTAEGGNLIQNSVIAVPVFFTEFERSAMLTVAELAGLRDVRLMNDLTAAALNWAMCNIVFLRRQRAPISIAFVDVGHSSTQVCIADFTSSRVTVKAHEYDPTAGGRDLDDALLEHFAGEVAQTFGQDIASHHQSYTRLARAVTTLREQLTVSEDDRIVLDDFMGAENDFNMDLDRATFKTLTANIIKKVEDTCIRATELCCRNLHFVEMVGSASRTPVIEEAACRAFQQPIQRTMHSKECVSRGCAYFAEMQNNPTGCIQVLDRPSADIVYTISGQDHHLLSPTFSQEHVGNERHLSVDYTFPVQNLHCTLNIGAVISGRARQFATISFGDLLDSVPKGARESGGSVVVPRDWNGQLRFEDLKEATMTYYKQVPPVPQLPVSYHVSSALYGEDRDALVQQWKAEEQRMVEVDEQQKASEEARNSLEKLVFEVQKKIEIVRLCVQSPIDLKSSIDNAQLQDDWLRNEGRDVQQLEYQTRHDKMLEEKVRLEDMYQRYMQEEEHRKGYTKKIQDWCQDVEESPGTLIPCQESDHKVRESEWFLKYRARANQLLTDAKVWLKSQGEAPSPPAQCVDKWQQIQDQHQKIWDALLHMQSDPKLQQTQHAHHKQEELAEEAEPYGAIHVAGASHAQLQDSNAEECTCHATEVQTHAPAPQCMPAELPHSSDACVQMARPGGVQTNGADTAGRSLGTVRDGRHDFPEITPMNSRYPEGASHPVPVGTDMSEPPHIVQTVPPQAGIHRYRQQVPGQDHGASGRRHQTSCILSWTALRHTQQIQGRR